MSPDPLASIRELVERAEAARRDADETIRQTQAAFAAVARIRATLPPDDRRWPAGRSITPQPVTEQERD